MEIMERLRAYLETVPLADGHEHYCTYRQFRDAAGGSFVALALLAYLRDDALALGALQLAKDGAARVMARKVRDGAFAEDVAREILRAIFFDNGARLWASAPAA